MDQELLRPAGQMLFDFEGNSSPEACDSVASATPDVTVATTSDSGRTTSHVEGDGNPLDCSLFDFLSEHAQPSPIDAPIGADLRLTQVARLALRFADLLGNDTTAEFDNIKVARLARETFGSAAGTARDTYDAAEAGMNIHLRRVGLDLTDVPHAMESLQALQDRMPRQTRRNEQQVELQQFSTPPAEALLVVTAVGLRPGMVVEPMPAPATSLSWPG